MVESAISLPEVSAQTVAKYCNVDLRRVQQLTKQGILPRVRRGKHDLLACLAAYIRYCQQQREDKDEHAERMRLLSAQADKAEIEAALMKHDVIPAQDVADGINVMVSNMRARLLAIPSSTAPLVSPDAPAPTEKIIRAKIYEALEELSRVKVSAASSD